MKTDKLVYLVFCLLLSVGFYFMVNTTIDAQFLNWYDYITKPYYMPPNEVFAPITFFLYILMGITGFLSVTSSRTKRKKVSLILTGIQLILILAFYLSFFHFHTLDIPIWIAAVLLIVTVIQVRASFKTNFLGGLAQVPFLVFLMFIVFTLYGLWAINPLQNSTFGQ